MSRNDTFMSVIVRSPNANEVYGYEIDRTTGTAELYLLTHFHEGKHFLTFYSHLEIQKLNFWSDIFYTE